MRIKHSLPAVQAKLRRLDTKAMEFAVWADTNPSYMDTPEIVGWKTKGLRIGRRYDRIAEKYGII